MNRWQSRVFVLLGAALGLTLVAGLVVAANLAFNGGAHAGVAERPAVLTHG